MVILMDWVINLGAKGLKVPLLLMGYYNSFLAAGCEETCKDSRWVLFSDPGRVGKHILVISIFIFCKVEATDTCLFWNGLIHVGRKSMRRATDVELSGTHMSNFTLVVHLFPGWPQHCYSFWNCKGLSRPRINCFPRQSWRQSCKRDHVSGWTYDVIYSMDGHQGHLLVVAAVLVTIVVVVVAVAVAVAAAVDSTLMRWWWWWTLAGNPSFMAGMLRSRHRRLYHCGLASRGVLERRLGHQNFGRTDEVDANTFGIHGCSSQYWH